MDTTKLVRDDLAAVWDGGRIAHDGDAALQYFRCCWRFGRVKSCLSVSLSLLKQSGFELVDFVLPFIPGAAGI